MHYVVQTDVFRESHYELMVNWLERSGASYEIVRVNPFEEDFEFTTDRKDVWCFGSTKMARLGQKYGWYPGSLYNENHDVEVYGKHYGNNMLNHDGIVMKFGDPLPEQFDYFFARPTQDLKAFTGKLFSREAWEESVNDVRDPQPGISRKKILTLETPVLLAPLKEIQQEVRCWIVGGRVVTASRYKIGERVVYQNYDHETFYIDFAQSMADIYRPAEAFVMDVCLANDELKIVEINCINCAGFYHMNVDKLMNALEEHFE